jgi:hypothetical protein
MPIPTDQQVKTWDDVSHWFQALIGLPVNPDTHVPAPGSYNVLGLIFDALSGRLLVAPPIKEGELYPSLARVATPSGVALADQKNPGARGVMVVIDITAAASPSIVFTIEGKDPSSGKYFTLLASAAQTGTTATPLVLRVFPGATGATNLIANDQLPRTWRVRPVHGNGNSATYTVGYSLLP